MLPRVSSIQVSFEVSLLRAFATALRSSGSNKPGPCPSESTGEEPVRVLVRAALPGAAWVGEEHWYAGLDFERPRDPTFPCHDPR